MIKKKNYLYAGFVGIFAVFAAFIMMYSKPKKESLILPLKDRIGAMALSKEWKNTKQTVEQLVQTLYQSPEDTKTKLLLAQAYIQEGRITGDHAYYDAAALKILANVVEREPDHFEALCLQATVFLSQHHFAEALEVAKKAQKVNEHNSFVYGLLCDANVELGNYNEAVQMADKMVSIRPDLTSYSRVSYLREIYGDNKGAIEAMKLAVSAGFPGLEQTAWCRMVLAKLYENQGELVNAKLQYDITLSQRPDYAYALAGLGKIEKANKNYAKAIENLLAAEKLIKDYTFSEELADIYALINEKEKSKAAANKAIEMLTEGAGEEGVKGHGHYADKELAYAYLRINDYENALKHALIEYNKRPKNNDVNETLAWVYYKKGEFKDAESYIKEAMKTNCQNPTLLCRAGLIKIKNGDRIAGRELISKALSQDPYLPAELTSEANTFLAMK